MLDLVTYNHIIFKLFNNLYSKLVIRYCCIFQNSISLPTVNPIEKAPPIKAMPLGLHSGELSSATIVVTMDTLALDNPPRIRANTNQRKSGA